MLIGIILAFIWFVAKNNTALTNSVFAQEKVHVASTYPSRMREDDLANQMVGHTQMNVRNPFGPNPQQKTIQEMKVFDTHRYQQEYKMNLMDMQIESQHFRFDDTMSGPVNHYQQPHQPQDNVGKMLTFVNCAPGSFTLSQHTDNAILI